MRDDPSRRTKMGLGENIVIVSSAAPGMPKMPAKLPLD
jgi:hypothetical protein